MPWASAEVAPKGFAFAAKWLITIIYRMISTNPKLTKIGVLPMQVSGGRIGTQLISHWRNSRYKIDGNDVRAVEAWFRE
jgi:hypothetical protein